MADQKQSIVDIAEICARRSVTDVVISPGSRSAPLALAFLRHPEIESHTVVDERCAAFVALGLAQQTDRPAMLVCTSGTAGLNYSPALAEAFYQRVPLLIFTADRPPEWIDQHDGQTLHQTEMYGKLCRSSFQLPVSTDHPDAVWHLERVISEALIDCTYPVPGPVHVNVPLREPLYPSGSIRYRKNVKIISPTQSQRVLPESVWNELLSVWAQVENRMAVAGLRRPSAHLNKHLAQLNHDERTALVCDITSNIPPSPHTFHSDIILGSTAENVAKKLRPNLVVSFGGPVVSKNLKLFLRQHKPQEHWHIDPSGQAVDTFQSLTRVIPLEAEQFFAELAGRVSSNAASEKARHTSETYVECWRARAAAAREGMRQFLSTLPHCEFSAMDRILKSLPTGSNLQLGNSFVVRMANFLGLQDSKRISVYSNRGTSGIDGTLSTAVGAAIAAEPKLTTLILGDLAFFYDRNALWQERVPPNLRVIIINNYGGGIFRLIDGAKSLPELAKHFEVEHNLMAKNTAEDHGLDYVCCNSKKSLDRALGTFFDSTGRAAILEVQTDKQLNVETFEKFQSMMRELR